MRNSSEPIDLGQVVGYGPNRTLYVQLRSGQNISTPVQYSYDGYADAYRIDQNPLPQIGTWGVILFPYRDDRNGIWIKSVYIGQTTAWSMGESGSDNFVNYHAHGSGYYTYEDQSGQCYTFYPDGTYVCESSVTTLPTINRNVIANDAISQTPVTVAERQLASPRNFFISHVSGTNGLIDPSGNVTLKIASGATFQIENATGQIIQMDASGNINVTGKSINLKDANGSTVVMDGAGNMTMTVADIINMIASTINLEAPVVLGTASGGTATAQGPLEVSVPSGSTAKIGETGATFLQLVTSAFVSVFNNHVHGNGNGGADTTAPTVAMTSSELTTTLLGS